MRSSLGSDEGSAGGGPGKGLLCMALLLVLGLAAVQPLQAQAGTIRGTVVDLSTRQPLANVQVFLPSEGIGTTTNPSGEYQLPNVPPRQVAVRAQLPGYGTSNQNVTVRPGATEVLNFALGASVIALDEVVVTGAGVATEKRKLGNTVATIDVARMEDQPVQNISEILAGREPGVTLLPAGGLTGEGARIRIRGSSSLSQSNEPIIYLNGVRIDNAGGRGNIGTGGGGQPSRLDDIDPSSIERIEILKGAAAATLYGSEASSGVIQIFTKRGSAGDTRWQFEVEQGFLTYPDRFAPNAGFVTSDTAAARLSDFYGMNIRPYEVFTRDFVTPLFETGYTSDYRLSVSGGNSDVTYFASGRYQYEDGPIGAERAPIEALGNDKANKLEGTVSLSIYPTEDLTLRVTSLYTQSGSNTISNNNSIYAPITLALFGQPQRSQCLRSEPIAGTGRCTGAGNPVGQAAFATVREAFQRSIEQLAQHFNGSVNANYRPVQGLTLDVTAGIDAVNQQDQLFYPFGYNLDRFTSNNIAGSKTVSDRNFRQFSVDGKLSWEARLSPVLTSSFVGGAQGFIERVELTGGSGRDFPGPGFAVADAGAVQDIDEFFQEIVNTGLYAQEQIGLNDWIFGTVGARFDYNSAFGESAGGAFYPKVSVSLVPSDLDLWNVPGISSMRLRAALGQAGLQPGAFDKLTTYGAIRSEFGPGVQPSNLGNPDLRPEVSTEWEIGTELGLLDDRLGIEATYWDRTTTDALISRQFPVSGGFLERQLVNIGEIAGQGVEIGVRGLAVQSRSFSMNLFANAAYLREKVVDLGGAPPLKVGGSYPRYRNWIREGYAPGAFFGPRVRNVEFPIDIDGDCEPDGRAELLEYFSKPIPGVTATGPFRVLVENGDPRPCGGGDDYLGLYLGKPTPDWSGSFGGHITFLGNFELSTLFEYKAGNFKVHNLTNGFRRAHPSLGGNLPGAVAAKATLANPSATPEERLDAALDWVTEYVALSPYDGLNEIENADLIRWRELGLTYNLPEGMARRLGATTMAITIGGRNLALWSKYSGPDPEVNLLGRNTNGGLDDFAVGIDAFGLPLPRRFTASVRVGF